MEELAKKYLVFFHLDICLLNGLNISQNKLKNCQIRFLLFLLDRESHSDVPANMQDFNMVVKSFRTPGAVKFTFRPIKLHSRMA